MNAASMDEKDVLKKYKDYGKVLGEPEKDERMPVTP